jgi:hypothetical protein
MGCITGIWGLTVEGASATGRGGGVAFLQQKQQMINKTRATAKKPPMTPPIIPPRDLTEGQTKDFEL